MFDEVNISKAVDKIMKNYEELNTYYITKVAHQIKLIGKLNPSSVNRIVLMTQWGSDIREITAKIAEVVGVSVKQVMSLYQKVLEDTFHDKRFAEALKHKELTPRDVSRLNQFTQAVGRQTAGELVNLANTTVAEQTYRDAVDKAVLAVSSGLSDYKQATRDVIRDLGNSGLQVQYPSGYHKRLDSAVQQNIIDGTRQLAQQTSDMMGQALGYDAVEIVAHAMSAPDHEPIQGRVFLLSEFEKLQSEQSFTDIDGNTYGPIRRAIGQWNCRHSTNSFSTQYSKRMWSDAQLRDMADKNGQGCWIDGKHYTMYGVSQLMRELETKARREKETAIAAQAAGDEELRKECQMRLNAISKKYNEVCAISGLRSQWSTRADVEGFRALKI